MDDLTVGAVAKRHLIEDDLPPDRGEVGRAGPLDHGRLGGEQLAELGDGRAALLVGVVELDQGLHGGEEGGQEQQVGGQLAHGDAPAGRHRATHPEEHGLGGDADGLAARPVERVGPGGPEVGVAVADDDIAVLGDAGVPAVVGRDHPDPGQRLREVAEEIADAVPHGAVVGRGPAPEPHRGRHRGRHRGHQGDDGQQRVVAEQQTGDHHQGQGLHREVDDPLLEQHRQGLDVRGHPGQQHARLLVGVEVHALALHVGEGSDAEALHQPLAEAAGERGAHRAERGGDHQQPRVRQGGGRPARCGCRPGSRRPHRSESGPARAVWRPSRWRPRTNATASRLRCGRRNLRSPNCRSDSSASRDQATVGSGCSGSSSRTCSTLFRRSPGTSAWGRPAAAAACTALGPLRIPTGELNISQPTRPIPSCGGSAGVRPVSSVAPMSVRTRAYSGTVASSSRWLPVAATRPPEMKTTLSARAIVDSR